MKALNRTMLMRLHRAVSKAELRYEQDLAAYGVLLRQSKGKSAVAQVERELSRMKDKDRIVLAYITSELERYFAGRYVREAKKTGDDANLRVVEEYARSEAALVLKFLL